MQILDKLKGDTFEIADVVKKERKRNPALPFTTSSLQQEAARKLNFRAKKTMMLAQQLYEGINLGKEGNRRSDYIYENGFDTNCR